MAGIVIRRLDAEPASEGIAKPAGRPVDVVDHQDVIALLDKRQDRRVDRSQAGAECHCPIATFERGHRFLESRMGRCAMTAVCVNTRFPAVIAGIFQRFHSFVGDGGGRDKRLG